MPALESHTGLLKQTIPYYNRRNFVNISNTKTHYTAFPAIQRNAKRAINSQWTKFQFGLPVETFGGGGYQFEHNVQVTSNNTGEWVSEDDPVSIDKRDFQVRANYPWRLARVQKWSYGEWELSACKGKEELVNLMTSRALGADQGAADWFETWFWSAPAASTDDRTAFPLRYFLFTEPESTAAAYSGFTGINVSTNGNLLNLNHNSYTAGPGGVSRATYRTAGNWNCQYTTFSDTDAVEKITHAALDTDFYSPVDFPNMVKEAPMKAMYTTKQTLITRGSLARQQNDANGSDLATRFTETDTFRIPMYHVPFFEDTGYVLYGSGQKNPIYGIDWNTWYWASKTGFRMEDKVFEPSLEAPMTFTHVRYLGGQLCCLEPRRNFVLSK
jgi:hypothetical protein